MLTFYFTPSDTSEIYTLSLHDALPIWRMTLTRGRAGCGYGSAVRDRLGALPRVRARAGRSEEHTSELQSRGHLVCRLLLEKKKATIIFSFIFVRLVNLRRNMTHVFMMM